MSDFALPLDVRASAELIEAAGTSKFARLLLSVAQVDELFGCLVGGKGEPETLISCSKLAGCNERVKNYIHRFYHHDPAARELSKIGIGDSCVQRIGLGDIIPYDYKDMCFNKPGFVEKLSFGWRGEDYLLFLNFYSHEPSTPTRFHQLASLANLALAIMAKRHAPLDKKKLVSTLERRLARSFPKLTGRERQVCARTVSGQSAKFIGANLGLSAGTVLTYRQRAYQRYGFQSASGFLPLIVN